MIKKFVYTCFVAFYAFTGTVFAESLPRSIAYNEALWVELCGTVPEKGWVTAERMGNIIYIKIPYFHTLVYEQMAHILEKSQGENIIVDLRGNFGGILEEAIQTADLFVSEGVLCTVSLKDENPKIYYAEAQDNIYQMVILVNAFTASSAELFAAALHENGKAVLLGTETYGKASIQKITPNQDGGIDKVTVGKYLTPKGVEIDGKGLIPDVLIFIDDSKDTQLLKAIDILWSSIWR